MEEQEWLREMRKLSRLVNNLALDVVRLEDTAIEKHWINHQLQQVAEIATKLKFKVNGDCPK